MQGVFADRLFRIAFALAGAYNLAFGFWAAIWPQAFFELFELAPPRYPGIWACLGMVIGVYGFLYWYAAWKLVAAWPIIAVGLLGKVLGPIGMAMSFDDDWPRRLGMLCVYNDFIWWLPFGLFLVRGTAVGNHIAALAPWWCVALHAAAYAAIPAVLQPGMPTVADVPTRGRYIAENVVVWSIGWSLWMMSAATLVGFYAWWGSRIAVATGGSPVFLKQYRRAACATAAVLLAALGMVCDFSGESLSILVLVERAQALGADVIPFTSIERSFTLLCAGIANGLYTIGGMILMFATPDLPRWIRTAMWGTWIAGLAMTIAGVMNHVGGMVVSTIVLFPLFIVWVAWMGAQVETSVKRIIVLGGLGQFGRTVADQLRQFGLDIHTATRGAGADLLVDAHDSASLRAALRTGDVVVDAAGPFQNRSTTLLETAIELGIDVIDINDDLRYAEAVLGLQPRIDRAGIRVLSSASSVSAIAAAAVRHSGLDEPRRVTAFLVPASRHTSSSGAARSLIRSVGETVRVFHDGRLQERVGWSDPRAFPMPRPIGPIRGRLFESADAVYLPRICPTLREVAMYVDTNTVGVNGLLTWAARWPVLRRSLEHHVDFCTWLARRLGSVAGGLGYEIENANGEVSRYALVAAENSFLAAVAPAVLAARAIAEDRFPYRGLVLPDRHVEPQELFEFLEANGLRVSGTRVASERG